jgi:hypothetical protein
MNYFSNQDIDVLTSIIFNENIFSKSSSIKSINNSCDAYNRMRYSEKDIEKSLKKFINLKIIKKLGDNYSVKKNFGKEIKRTFNFSNDYFKISHQLELILKSYTDN